VQVIKGNAANTSLEVFKDSIVLGHETKPENNIFFIAITSAD
jgi:hypothetical protein